MNSTLAPAACAATMGRAGSACQMPDPLDLDLPSDEVVVTTRRGLTRLALVATEVASRFQREAVAHDAMAWMLAPRALFGGSAAIDACLDRDACLRGVLLHGLSLGLDADPLAIDALAADDDGPICDAGDGARRAGHGRGRGRPQGVGRNVVRFPSGSSERPKRLFTATVVAGNGVRSVQAFHASLAIDADEIMARLRCRIGPAVAGARILDGFDPSDPMVEALVSPAMCDTLLLIAEDPASPLAAGLDVNVEQSFSA